MVYLHEAHASDGARPRAGIEVQEPKTLEERFKVAASCRAGLKLKFPVLIDDMKNSTDKGYSAFPDRLFLVGKDRKVLYRGGPGPRGFKPSELEGAMKELLGASKKKALSDEQREAILKRLRERRRKKLSEGK